MSVTTIYCAYCGGVDGNHNVNCQVLMPRQKIIEPIIISRAFPCASKCAALESENARLKEENEKLKAEKQEKHDRLSRAVCNLHTCEFCGDYKCFNVGTRSLEYKDRDCWMPFDPGREVGGEG